MQRKIPLVVALPAVLFAFLLGLWIATPPDTRLVALSPTGLYRIDFVVAAKPWVAMPGGGSDVGGNFALVSRDTGKVLAKSGYCPLLSGFSYDTVKWTDRDVSLVLPEADGLRSVTWSFR